MNIKSKLSKWRGPLWLIAICFLIFWIIFGYKYQFVLNTGDSMSPTYLDKEWIIVQKISTLGKDWEPQRFDVVLIKNPKGASAFPETLNKRVIGISGDTIEIKEGYIFLNGNKFIDQFGKEGRLSFYLVDENDNDLYYWGTKEKVKKYVNKGKIKILEGHVWLIGDNREISWKRFSKVISIPCDMQC